MTYMNELLDNERFQIIVTFVLFVISLFAIYVVYRLVLKVVRKKVRKTESVIDDFIIDIFRVPLLWLLFWIVFSIFTSSSFIAETRFYATLAVFNRILLILSIGWVLIKVVRALFYYFQNRLNINTEDNLNARRDLTKIKVFEGLFVALISFLTITACLMSFKEVRSIGISLLTSAGIAGIVIGFAAQKSIATFFAGIQIANIQVTDTKERCMELRILVSSTDSSKNCDLRVDIRERMIKYLNDYHPGCFVRTRIDQA